MSSLAIVAAFSGWPDARRGEGRRQEQALCLALFTLAVSAGCQGFLAINDWLGSYRTELLELFHPAKSRLPSYSTIDAINTQKSGCISRAERLRQRALRRWRKPKEGAWGSTPPAHFRAVGTDVSLDGLHLRYVFAYSTRLCHSDRDVCVRGG